MMPYLKVLKEQVPKKFNLYKVTTITITTTKTNIDGFCYLLCANFYTLF